jgi:tRNA uridine 5-carboxymethylaminomethyl modification enzyme
MNNNYIETTCDAVVIGAGHAGCESALALARLGFDTVMLTLNLESIAFMACNPSIGGTAKGHLVREIDALGGEMGINADKACMQIRMLNRGKGSAVQSLRAQSDKHLYHALMKKTL